MSLSPGFSQACLCEITGSEFVARTLRLRYEVWSKEATLRPDVVAQGLITDWHDAHARHWAVFDGDSIVAAARMCVHGRQEETPDYPPFSRIRLPAPVATINRLVVHPTARNHGLASKLDERRITAAREDGAKCVVGTAARSRIAPLERLGFRLIEEKEHWLQHYTESVLFYPMVLHLES